MMRKRNISNNTPRAEGNSSSSDESSSDEESNIIAAHPQEMTFNTKHIEEISFLYTILAQLKEGKMWWAKCITIYIAAFLTYSYHNVGTSINVQIAVMTVMTVVGATPFVSSHLIPVAIGTFVGGQNIIGSTGVLLEDNNIINVSNYIWLLLLSGIVGLVWCFVITSELKILDGYAGRLGTTTFIGMNITMFAFYGPIGVVNWNRYWYGFVNSIHIAEEDSSLNLASVWDWTEEAELAIGYVLSVLWLGCTAGGIRIRHNDYIKRCNSSGKQSPAPLNNVLIPVLLALLSMLLVNASNYKHAPGLYNGFAVGAYVAMASLEKIPSIAKFATVSTLAAGWGLALTPFFVGFAGKSGFTSMLGHVTHVAFEKMLHRLQVLRKQRHDELRRQLEQLQHEMKEQQQALQSTQAAMNKHEEDEPPPFHQHHKPKKETFYTKQQRRQQQRLKHLKEDAKSSNEQQTTQNPPKLHHRAWSALPVDGDGEWHHSLENQQELNSVV